MQRFARTAIVGLIGLGLAGTVLQGAAASASAAGEARSTAATVQQGPQLNGPCIGCW